MNGRPISSTLTSLFVALATVALTACGADDAAPDNEARNASSGSAPQAAASIQGPSDTASASSPFADAATSSLNPASPADSASSVTADAAVVSVQASLAADSRQIAPVMHYAPGDDSN